MFHAKNFIFNGIPSETYGLHIGEMNSSGESTTDGSGDVSLLTQKIYRRPVPYLFGTEQTPCLQFPLSIYSENEITASAYSNISSWLFGKSEYGILRICQDDMSDVFYRCFLTNPQTIRVGNIIRGFTTTVISDSPWAWKEPKTLNYTFTGVEPVTNILFFNESANSFYTYPTNMVIRANQYSGYIMITNVSDNSRMSKLGVTSGSVQLLSGNEVITLNCDLQLISSSLTNRPYPLQIFNQKWPRFIQGINNLRINGNIASLNFTYPVAFKAG